ncbi:MAG: YceD family protein [Ilumatobacter sp.]|uniref:YceD family protein n=1 Tax=Ilumatobacter sp. TaxID=1967498 RepID=UPI003918FDFE
MNDDGLRELRVNAVELLRQPGAIKEIDATVSAHALDIEHSALSGDVTVAVELEAINDGITVRGTVSAPWTGACRRCLQDLSGVIRARVDELYQTTVTDDEAFPIENNQLDLAPMARQTALLELGEERLCRVDCAGLCPVCGIDRNAAGDGGAWGGIAACDCDTTVRDDRWAALEGLRFDE